jgi:sortase A
VRSERHSRRRRTLALIASIGSVALGVALVSWALLNIEEQTVQTVDPAALGTRAAGASSGATLPAGSGASSGSRVPDGVLYPVLPAQGDAIGTLSIPALRQTLPIIEGTRTRDLKRGVGHYVRSVLPGEKDNCVLSGHRDTVFAGLGKLKKGDLVIARTSAGAFTYRITGIRIVRSNDRTVIVPTDHAVLTLSTCYPFNYVGNAPKRYVLIADLVTRPPRWRRPT